MGGPQLHDAIGGVHEVRPLETADFDQPPIPRRPRDAHGGGAGFAHGLFAYFHLGIFHFPESRTRESRCNIATNE